MKKVNHFLMSLVLVFAFTIVAFAMGDMDMGGKDMHKHGSDKDAMAMCPLDGMMMKKSAMISFKYKNETLYFCSKKEMEKFKKSPAKYLKQTAICPVSKMRVFKKKAIAYKYNGKTYYFCCKMYLDAFKKNPKKYVK